jgi:hypothetical protein
MKSGKPIFYFALLLLIGAAFVVQSLPAVAQMTSVGIDCSQIHTFHVDMQDNMRASRALVECGLMQGGHQAYGFSNVTTPPNIRASNRKCTSSQACTKSESMSYGSTKDGGQTIVVNYNDEYYGNGSDYSGTSYSTDGGAHFKEINPPPFSSGHGTNYGDPIVVFNSKTNLFYAGDLVTECGGQGVGLWTSKDGKTWKAGACAHNGSFDDRESFWVDNEPTSGTYGRMYVSYNDYATSCGAGGCLFVTYSDDGKKWNTPVQVGGNANLFLRDVQITGTPAGTTRFEGKNSTVFIAAMDEGGGGNAQRQNYMFKSLDGGKTWTFKTLGPSFNPVGDTSCGYFYQVNPIWRHMGWGEPAVGPNGVVHYDYAGAGKGSDHGDIFYVRSTDNGKTWSKPIELNTDKDGANKTQWMPSLSADLNGNVTASWYDRRKAKSACVNVTDPGCNYERVGRQSKDNGATWASDITISTAVIPEPAQDDPFVVGCYAGDYDYSTALNGNAFITWTDGRRKVQGTNVQDVDFAKVPEPTK